MEERVLFIDDEPNVLSSIKRMLFDETYEQYFAGSAEEALTLLKQTQISVIVSDMRMPIMDGVEFLEKSREIRPDAIRIILSGQADISSVMEAINRGGIWRYISKPWNDNDLKCTIRNAFELYRIQQERLMLLLELERKNNELKELNQDLERRVARRTQQIEAQKNLMLQMIDGMDLPSFATTSCKIIGDLVNSQQVTFLHSVGTQSIICLKDSPSESQKQALVSALLSGKDSMNNGYAAFPVTHASLILGAIGIGYHSANDEENIREMLGGMLPVLSLILGQFKMITDAPGLIGDLDDLIDRL